MLRRAMASWATGPRSCSGRRSWLHGVRRRRSWWRTRICTSMCRTGWPDRSSFRTGPRWRGRRRRGGRAGTGPRRQDRRWATSWSPQQISHRLRVGFPDDESMRISHEAIYQALYIQGHGALKRELVACLRTGRALRVPRARSRRRANGHVTSDVMISERPAEAEDRAVPGHQHARLRIDTGLEVYFADPHSPWQRGTNENTNGLLRQYFPKGTDLSRWGADESGRGSRSQQQAPENPRLEDTGRGPERASSIGPGSRCCDDRLSPRNTPRPNSAAG